ncbi:MAG: hypothetical protein JXB50_11700 [Spirochaetes bacterium]|nr:hypothetical protein [Spirochaetota bacterium]
MRDKFSDIKNIHIIGIGGCASSAIAEFLIGNNFSVTGSELKKRDDINHLIEKGITIYWGHNKNNICKKNKPDLVLYSPAITALNPNNPEIITARNLNIPLMSWEEFIGNYFDVIGKKGVAVCGSEGKGTTAGVLTILLKNTEWDPVSILGAKIKNLEKNINSNIYLGKGKSYILEGDEYNRNFHNYHPSICIMLNFEFEHPETYKDFNDYQESFFKFFKGMQKDKILILRASKNIINFVKKYDLEKSHDIIWFEKEEKFNSLNFKNCCIIKNHILNENGNYFSLNYNGRIYDFFLPALPGFMVYNSTGAILTALMLGVGYGAINNALLNFRGMIRRFDVYKTKNNGTIITDYGHSPESINNIVNEIRTIYKGKIIHLIFQPHLYSRTFNFFKDFIKALSNADRVTLIDIYPAREISEDWQDKISSLMLYEALKKMGIEVYYAGKSSDISKNLINKISENEINCFIGAGDMDQYYGEIIKYYT